MNPHQELHHYTTVNTLALILQSRKIRFNRLDRLDDIAESDQYGDFHLSSFLFVSCWTDSDVENISLWDRYSKGMTGVKISLPADPFEYHPLKEHPLLDIKILGGEVLSFLPIEEMFTDEYMVSPSFLINRNLLIRKVEYLDESELIQKRREAVEIVEVNGQFNAKMKAPHDLTGYKSKIWALQQEVRYVLMIYPMQARTPSGALNPAWAKDISVHLYQKMTDGTKMSKEYFDIPIDEKYFNNMKITLGPRATEADRIIVKSLLEKYTTNGVLLQSSLTGRVR